MLQPTPKQNIFLKLLYWHYLKAPKTILRGWLNFLKFNLSYFSIGLLLKTLFSPWRRDVASYGRGFDLRTYVKALFENTITRLLGALIRLTTVIVGLIIELMIFIAGLLLLIFWLALPFLAFFCLWSSIFFFQQYGIFP